MTNPILRELLNHISFNLDSARQSDGEQGSHETNNRHAERWKKENPALLAWFIKLREIEDRLICPECSGNGWYSSEAQARTGDPIQHQCERCRGEGVLSS